MTRFLEANWIWILLIGGMLAMHLRHRHGSQMNGHMGGHSRGGCGGGHSSPDDGNDQEQHDDAVDGRGHADQPNLGPGDDRSAPTSARRHGGC